MAEGYNGPLIGAEYEQGYHFVDLWNHEDIQLKRIDLMNYVVVELEPFNKKYFGTNNEGSVNVIAHLPILLSVKTEGDKITIDAKEGTSIKVWQGSPSF